MSSNEMKIASVEPTDQMTFTYTMIIRTILRYVPKIGSFRFIVFEDIALSICGTIRNCAYDNMGDNIRGTTIVIYVRTVRVRKRISWICYSFLLLLCWMLNITLW